MKIIFTTSVAGERFVYRNGEEVTVRDDIAKEFIRAGQAVKARPGVPVKWRNGRAVEVAVATAGIETRG